MPVLDNNNKSEQTRIKHIEEAQRYLMEEQLKSNLSAEEFYGIIEHAIRLNKADILNS